MGKSSNNGLKKYAKIAFGVAGFMKDLF